MADAAQAPTISVRTTSSTAQPYSTTTTMQGTVNILAPPASYALGALITLTVLAVTIYLISIRKTRN